MEITTREGSTTNKDVLYIQDLKHNLLSISQLCDKGYKVNILFESYQICNEDTGKVVFTGKRFSNIYFLDIHHNVSINECLISKDFEAWLWHRILAQFILTS